MTIMKIKKRLQMKMLRAWAKGKTNKGNKLRQKLIRKYASEHANEL